MPLDGSDKETEKSLQDASNDRGNNRRKLTADQWTSDIDMMISFMRRTHPNLHWKTSQEDFDKHVVQLKSVVPQSTDNEIIAGLCKLASLVKDGHTQFIGGNLSDRYFPVRIESFSDGCFVTSVSKEYAGLYGCKVLRIGNCSSAEAFENIGAATSHDNRYSKLYWSSRNLTMNSLLNGLGIIDKPDLLMLEIVDETGTLKRVSIEAENYPFKDDPYHKWFWHGNAVPSTSPINLVTETRANPPLRLKNFGKPYWFEYLEDQNAVYFCFDSCENDAAEPFDVFIDRLWKMVETRKPQKLIIDLRNNFGGTNSYLQPLIHGVIRHDEVNKSGHLFVMISRKTFSAALHCATWIERNAQPILVGEPTGAAPNHCADVNGLKLPNSNLLLLVSTTYWQNGWPWDKREWIDPEIKVDVASYEYFEGEDRALESIFTYSGK